MKIKLIKDIDLSKVIMGKKGLEFTPEIDSFIGIFDDEICKKYISNGTEITDFINNFHNSKNQYNSKCLTSDAYKVMNYLYYREEENEEKSPLGGGFNYKTIKTFIINSSIIDYHFEKFDLLRYLLYLTNNLYLFQRSVGDLEFSNRANFQRVRLLLIFNDGYHYININSSGYGKDLNEVKRIVSLILKAQTTNND